VLWRKQEKERNNAKVDDMEEFQGSQRTEELKIALPGMCKEWMIAMESMNE
jgi:hypothetical protein